VFVLQDSKGEELETRCFTVENGWFQDVDKESGEDRYTISLEDYNHTFCMNCGQRIEETECQEHRPSAKKEKK
jgi:Fe2+ or Zn2+ uptake regulation protein